jgi:hypothetical protein
MDTELLFISYTSCFSVSECQSNLLNTTFKGKWQDPGNGESEMRQCPPKCKIFGQAQRPAPTKACRGDPLWSPVSTNLLSKRP